MFRKDDSQDSYIHTDDSFEEELTPPNNSKTHKKQSPPKKDANTELGRKRTTVNEINF